MAVFKCKMCGGDLNITETDKVVECEYCGTTQTVPAADSERKMTLFNRANKLRLNNEFDKAAGIYESIIADFPEEAEAYWGVVLCQYGIEYVDDPATGKKIPTCHRSSFESVLEDDNFAQACENADTVARRVYREEAKRIEEIRKGIIEVSSKEEPYDIFICYKETDENGDRTVDSAIAQDVYTALTEKGYRVFFSRISLEDKLGQEYEPYIFAALNSARIMLVFGTDFEYFDAVWVKNEWSRFLQLIAAGQKKTLIPCYKDIDAYDMPKEFAKLQSQDMGKVGAIQDLLRGIEKILPKAAPAQSTAPVQSAAANSAAAQAEALLKRAFMFLEDGNWQSADEYCEKVLDQDPENAQAYLGKLMAELRVKKKSELRECRMPFDGKNNYQKAERFGDKALKDKLAADNAFIRERNENDRLTGIYDGAVLAMKTADTEEACKAASTTFKTIPGFKDADALAEQCLEKAEVCRKDAIYASAKAQMIGNKINDYVAAINTFRMIPGWKDTDAQISACQSKIEEIKAKEKADQMEMDRKVEERRIAAKKTAKKRKKVIAVTAPIVVVFIVFVIVLTTIIIPNRQYQEAVEKYGSALKNASVGDIVMFGSYEQDNDFSNGREEIEWLVLAKENDRVFVISKYALDCQRYNTSYSSVTWESCSLRRWLNGSFANSAFNGGERKMIAQTTVTADKNPSYSTSPGNNTKDKVFLLSSTEVNKYFGSDDARQCQGTAYCYAKGAYKANNGNCMWWLRSPGVNSLSADYVYSDNSVRENINLHYGVNYDRNSVRPALWINLGS